MADKKKIAISKDPVFYAKKCTSGFYAIYADGNAEFVNASYNSIEDVRKFVDASMSILKIKSYTLTFHEAEYAYYLSERGIA